MLSRNKYIAVLVSLAAIFTVPTTSFAGQGVQRMLYTVPNNTFIENSAGDIGVVTINDTSGSITTLQTLINNARSANPASIIVIHLLSGATYWANNTSGGLVLGSQECLVGSGATIQATNSAVTSALIQINSGATNVSVSGGTLNANGANIYGIYASSSAARVNIDKVTVKNCGQDCIQLNGNGSGTFDNELTVTRCDVSGSSGHSGISIQNATQATCVDNFCHNNSVGIWIGNCGYANVANNTCVSDVTGISCNGGDDNYIVNNTCNNNGTGIYVGGSANVIVSDSLASNSIAGIYSGGNGNIFSDNLFSSGNAVNFSSNGSGDKIVAYKGALNASGQNYFYPPLIDDQHNATIVNGMGRTDLTIPSTTIDNVQSQYNSAVSANPGSVIVLHLNGTFTVGSTPLTLSSYACVLLNGTIQINSSTGSSSAIYATGASYISVSGGTIDGGNLTGNNGMYFTGTSMIQVDAVTLQNFGADGTRKGGSDVIAIDHGATPRIFTRCKISGGAARGLWLATGGIKNIVSDCESTGVNEDGVDCDESTSSSLVKFCYLHDNVRYGIFFEQSASHNLALGNVCNNNSSYDIGCYNNSATPRGATAYNSIICNALLGGNGLRNGSTGDGNSVTSSDNFFFNNTVINANSQSQLYGSQNYYSQNYFSGSSLSISGTEVFFNSPDVSGNLEIRVSDSGLDALVKNAATTNNAPVVTGVTNNLGNNVWQLIPTDGGYYKVINQNSGLAMNVSGASTNASALVIQWPFGSGLNDQWMLMSTGNGLYNLVNRLSGLSLDVSGANAMPGTQLDQQPFIGAANQEFSLIDAAPPAAFDVVSWNNGSGNGEWNVNGSLNWSNLTSQVEVAFLNPEVVIFDDSITHSTNATLSSSTNIDIANGQIIVPTAITNSSTVNYTIKGAGKISGATSLVKLGSGTLTISTTNDFTGAVTVNAGTLALASGNNSLSGLYNSSGLTINGGMVQVNNDNGLAGYGSALGSCPVTINVGGTLTGLGSADTGKGTSSHIRGLLIINGGTLTMTGSQIQPAFGSWDLDDGVATTGGTNTSVIAARMIVPDAAGGTTFNIPSGGTASGIDLLVSGTFIKGTSGNDTGIIKTGNGTMALDNGIDWTNACIGGMTINGGTLQLGTPADTVAMTNLLGRGGVTNNATLNFASSRAVTVTNVITGTGNLIVTGGTGILTAASTYTGSTTIKAGTLALSGSISNSAGVTIATGATLDASGRANQTFVVNSGQILQGGGAINVNLIVGANATVMPGDATGTGTLTVGGTAQLLGMAIAKLNAATTNSDQIIASHFVYGGTLIVTNISGVLAAGQTFQLFAGANYSGAFSSIQLPVLSSGLAWNTNNFAAGGTLQVVSMAILRPQITAITLSGTNLIFTGTNATSGEQFVLLSSTNLASSLNQWAPVLTNIFDNNGNFHFTNNPDPNSPQQFYLLKTQN